MTQARNTSPRRVLVTGAAGFIGMHCAMALSQRGHTVRGVDNFNAYYDVALKQGRREQLAGIAQIDDVDITDRDRLGDVFETFKPEVVLHLAAQAGVRHSLTAPFEYLQSNVIGHTAVLEACRSQGEGFSHLVYASSSSVYGNRAETPFSEDDPVNEPTSLYAATKRADELISSTYAHLYGLRQIGLRLFTVYGAWGRPDMAYWIFTEKIFNGEPIRVFNHGNMLRDFTYIDDIVGGIVSTVETMPEFAAGERFHRVYNLGNNTPEALLDMISVLEEAIGKKAELSLEPMPAGDVPRTCADISAIQRDYGFSPTTKITDGLPKFVDWYRRWSALRPT